MAVETLALPEHLVDKGEAASAAVYEQVLRLDEPRHLETFIDAAMHPAVRARIESTLEGLASSK